jgi:Zn-dependent protease with chaperone function
MDEELLAKCSCSHCGNHLEFPLEGAGAIIACPHCGQQTQLTLQAPPQSERPSAAELLAGFTGTIRRPRVSFFYQIGLILVTLVMLILPVIYVGIIIAAAWGIYLFAAHFGILLSGLRGPRIWLLKTVLYIVSSLVGVVFIFFMVKPLFARRAARAQPLAMNPAYEPTLYAFIAKICDLVGAPMPKRIDLDCEINAAASFRRGAASLFSNDLVLTIGVPLVGALSLREFGGIIAHEFGHFTQGFGMRLSYIVRNVNGWFARLVYQRDAWDVALDEWASESEDPWVMLVVSMVQFGIGTSRLILKLLMFLGHTVSCFMLRQMEYNADSYEIKVAGSAAFESTTRRVASLQAAADKAYKEMRATWNLNRRLPDNFSAFLCHHESQLPLKVREKIQDTLGLARTRVFSAHPSPGDRIRCARQAGEPGVFHLDYPASVLFTKFDVVSRQITHLHYTDDLGLQFEPVNLRPVIATAPATH